jgi:hypothetical protein
LHDVHTDSGIIHRNVCPDLIDHSTRIVQGHLSIYNLSEQATPVSRAEGYEIQTG